MKPTESEIRARRAAIAAQIIVGLAENGIQSSMDSADDRQLLVGGERIAWVSCETRQFSHELSGRINVEMETVRSIHYQSIKPARTVEATDATIPKIIAALVERLQLRAEVERQRAAEHERERDTAKRTKTLDEAAARVNACAPNGSRCEARDGRLRITIDCTDEASALAIMAQLVRP